MPSNPAPSKATPAAQGNPAAAQAATAAALPAANVAPVQPVRSQGYVLANVQPGHTYGVRVAHPANPAASLVLPWRLPQGAKPCAVVVYGQVAWLGVNGRTVPLYVHPSPYRGYAAVVYPATKPGNPTVAFAVRGMANVYVAGHPTMALPKP